MKLKTKKVEKAELRDHAKGGKHKEELRSQLKGDIKAVTLDIDKLLEKKRELESQLLALSIEPFEIGGYALVEIASGRSKKWQKCLLECENGILYARPVKEDGSLSGRHFSVIPVPKMTYADVLKEVE